MFYWFVFAIVWREYLQKDPNTAYDDFKRTKTAPQKHPSGRPPVGAGCTERMTIMMTPEIKRLLHRMCADDVTAAEWLEQAVAKLYPTYAK